MAPPSVVRTGAVVRQGTPARQGRGRPLRAPGTGAAGGGARGRVAGESEALGGACREAGTGAAAGVPVGGLSGKAGSAGVGVPWTRMSPHMPFHWSSIDVPP